MTPIRIIALAALLLCAAAVARAQEERLPVREQTTPEELISVDDNTPFVQAMGIFNNASKRFRSKPVLYEGDERKPIGIFVSNMYWLDAFELVLRANNCWYEDFPDYLRVYPLDKSAKGGPKVDTTAQRVAEAMRAREVQISAVFFEANRTELEKLGIDWLFTNQTPSSNTSILMSNSGNALQQQGGGSSSDDGGNQEVELGNITAISIGNGTANLLAALRVLQSENLGELISSPNVTVRSGEKGRIQVGQDFSIKQKDFSGNTIDKFYSAGTIIEVTPVVMVKDDVEFVNLSIAAERSSVVPDPVSTIVNKTTASTAVLLLNNEETAIGGLMSHESNHVRRGVPILKDLPWWVFGLRYLFGYEETQVVKKELIIILKASIVPSVEQRLTAKMEEIRGGQNSLMQESERLEIVRTELLRQIEQAKKNRTGAAQ